MDGCRYRFLPQCLLGLIHVHRLLLMKFGVWCLREWGDIATEVRLWPPKKALSLRSHCDHPSGLSTNPSSWNLRVTLLWPCSWAHLLPTLLYLWACGTGTIKIFLQCLTTTVSNLWLHYLYFLELTLQRLVLRGTSLDFLFHTLIYLSFVQSLHEFCPSFFKHTQQVGGKHQFGCLHSSLRIPPDLSIWVLLTH